MPLNSFAAVNLPYCLKRLDDGRYIVLNREYKPLGFKTSARVIYADYPIAVWYKGLTPNIAAKVSWNASSDINIICLYNDGCNPVASKANMDSYLARLAILAKLEVSEKEPRGRWYKDTDKSMDRITEYNVQNYPDVMPPFHGTADA